MFSVRATSRIAPAATRAFSSTPRASLARMTVVGRLGVSPEQVPTSTDRTMIRYIIGSDSGKGDSKKTSWFRIAHFVNSDAQKDFVLGLPKGSLLHVDADARMDTYNDAEGNKRSSLSLVVKNLDVLSRPRVEYSEHETNEEGLVQEAAA